MVLLPDSGRTDSAPEWPFEDPTVAELAVWIGLWALPQAVAWERLQWVRVVARYVRVLLVAEAGSINAMPETRQLEDRLGLTPMAMLRLRWEIAPADDIVAPVVVGEGRWADLKLADGA